MAECVQTSSGVKRWSIICGENYSRGSDGCAHCSGRNHTHANRTRRLISRTGHDGRSALQASSGSARRRDSPTNFGRLIEGGQQRLVHVNQP